MKKTILLVFVILLATLSIPLAAQPAPSKFPELKPRQNLYVELGGNGIAFNATYESRFRKSSDGPGFKVGAGGFTGSFEKVFTLPVGANWLLTKDNKHFFELGVGATFLHYEDTYDWGWTGGPFVQYPVDVAGLTIDKMNSVFGHMTMGYRRQPSNGGITWGVAVTPQFNQNGFWPIWLGLKFGYSFARK